MTRTNGELSHSKYLR